MLKGMTGFLYALALAAPGTALAEDVLLKVGDPLARAEMLKPGVHRYLRYVLKDGHRNTVDIWERRTAFEERDGKRLVRVTQLWDRVSEPGYYFTEDSLLEAGTMKPLTHVRTRTKEGKTETFAFRFDGASVKGIADYPENTHKDFTIAGSEPIYNFVVDIEFLRQLPLVPGRAFIATLYDPPSGEPARFTFKVAGSEKVPGPDGVLIDCWLVTTDYNRPDKPVSRFWIAKRNQVLVRQETILDDGRRLFKTLISSESTDPAG